MELVIDRNVQTGGLVNFFHHLQEGRPMAFVDALRAGTLYEEIGVDHFVQDGFLELVVGAEFEKRFREGYHAGLLALILAGSSAECHPFAPFDHGGMEHIFKKVRVVELKEVEDVGRVCVRVVVAEVVGEVHVGRAIEAGTESKK